MTREQAIAYGKRVIDLGLNDETQAFCELAIKALEQEPCEDAVSRAEVVDELNRLGRNAFKDDTDYDNFFAFLDSLPSVTPTQEWIPCSDRLPEEKVEVLVTTEWGNITIAERYSANDYFINDGAANADEDEITAWMPLPLPWKGE